ncbi:hypothetical protein E2C01_063025 [Portunus trituberculatus]|uniref:Uncharacterized protein n=1 Tax=Portunus trituberculatus TaxID=210409 RepID=A0A5B7HFT2_PORTR|nr:hypothetical protein [Portunus trituberculatus]
MTCRCGWRGVVRCVAPDCSGEVAPSGIKESSGMCCRRNLCRLLWKYWVSQLVMSLVAFGRR